MAQDEVVVVRWKEWHTAIIRRHKEHWLERTFRRSSILAIAMFIGSLAVQGWAVTFATEKASNPVTDLILSNTKALDVDFFFVWGMVLLIAFISYLCLVKPKRIPFVLHSLTLFIVIRSMFVSLTHISPFPEHTVIDFGTAVTKVFFGADLFFSGHTGAPFLMALIFWNNIKLRYIFLAWSLFFAGVVLLGHLHYSIDVASAFFITFAIYHIALKFFPEEKTMFDEA